ncbi:MAG TPA: sigma-70 family RNA polymerase sigma factor [Chitinophaga sp.]|uniref:RNA polymerase sigma factor n=1 Tax=Chitinophaga sp. TaxID=1869181 RepID=UPI002DBFF4C0|nr:sigma-70 family RNA polymerase sigma factor [Chitinophaga sp.]HEU4551562.1 sigma-70 family RNA polymerase sigma factor [Chitinophaga sp.]
MELTVPNEAALWRQVIAGDRQAFKTLYEAYADLLFAYACRYVADREIIRDCIHDLFVDLYGSHRNLAPQPNVKYYLLVSFRRKLHARQKKASLLALQEDMTFPGNTFSLAFNADDIESRLIANEAQREQLQQLTAEMNRLPARQKEILYLKYHCGLEYEEIAALMNITIPTCRTLAYRAIRQLRRELLAAPAHALGLLLFLCTKNF